MSKKKKRQFDELVQAVTDLQGEVAAHTYNIQQLWKKVVTTRYGAEVSGRVFWHEVPGYGEWLGQQAKNEHLPKQTPAKMTPQKMTPAENDRPENGFSENDGRELWVSGERLWWGEARRVNKELVRHLTEAEKEWFKSRHSVLEHRDFWQAILDSAV